MPDKHRFNNYDAELKAVREYLKIHTATATMVSVALDIYRPSLCRYKTSLQQDGELVVTHKAVCQITGYHADYLSCNPKLVKGVVSGK